MAVTHLPVWVDGENVCAGGNFGTMAGGRGGQARRHRAHAADGDIPVSGAPAEHVVQKANVLPQRLIVEAGEGADQCIGGDQTPDQVVAHRVDDGVSDRIIDHGSPGGRGLGVAAGEHSPTGLLAGGHWFEQRRPELFGHQPAAPVELGEPVLITGGADRSERVLRPDQQARAPGRSRVGGVRRKLTPRQSDRDTQVGHDA
ncbi:hypothetical protein LRC484719_15330 [Mycobacterium riyadhense]